MPAEGLFPQYRAAHVHYTQVLPGQLVAVIDMCQYQATIRPISNNLPELHAHQLYQGH